MTSAPAPPAPSLARQVAVRAPVATRESHLARLRRASADLGSELADHPPAAADAVAVAAWLVTVARRVGYDWESLEPSPVPLARAHGVVAARLAGASEVADAVVLAASARALQDRLECRAGAAGR